MHRIKYVYYIDAQKIVLGNSDWSGDAATAYTAAAGRQAAAASRLASISGTTSNTLFGVAGGGLLFYLALAAVLAKLITASATAIAAFGRNGHRGVVGSRHGD